MLSLRAADDYVVSAIHENLAATSTKAELFRTISRARSLACGEIAIMEYVGFEPHTTHANIQTGNYNHVGGTAKGSKI